MQSDYPLRASTMHVYALLNFIKEICISNFSRRLDVSVFIMTTIIFRITDIFFSHYNLFSSLLFSLLDRHFLFNDTFSFLFNTVLFLSMKKFRRVLQCKIQNLLFLSIERGNYLKTVSLKWNSIMLSALNWEKIPFEHGLNGAI